MNEYILKKIDELERKLEKYYHLLLISDELDMILKGCYIFDEDIEKILNGNYEL